MDVIFGLVRWVVVIVLLGVILFRIFRIIRPFETGLVERLGKYNRQATPGLNIVIPGLERIIIVDMREQVIDVPPQEVITKDNVTITVDAVIYHQDKKWRLLREDFESKYLNDKIFPELAQQLQVLIQTCQLCIVMRLCHFLFTGSSWCSKWSNFYNFNYSYCRCICIQLDSRNINNHLYCWNNLHHI